MAIMWDAQKPDVESEPMSRRAWRLRFAQMLVASGWDASVIREALVPDHRRSALVERDDSSSLSDAA